ADGDPRRRRRLLPIAVHRLSVHPIRSGKWKDRRYFGLGRPTPDADLSNFTLRSGACDRPASVLLLLPATGRAGPVDPPLDRHHSGIGLYEFARLDARDKHPPAVGAVSQGRSQ